MNLDLSETPKTGFSHVAAQYIGNLQRHVNGTLFLSVRAGILEGGGGVATRNLNSDGTNTFCGNGNDEFFK